MRSVADVRQWRKGPWRFVTVDPPWSLFGVVCGSSMLILARKKAQSSPHEAMWDDVGRCGTSVVTTLPITPRQPSRQLRGNFQPAGKKFSQLNIAIHKFNYGKRGYLSEVVTVLLALLSACENRYTSVLNLELELFIICENEARLATSHTLHLQRRPHTSWRTHTTVTRLRSRQSHRFGGTKG